MLARGKDPQEGGSRVAIIMNGSPLFTGDAGSGESEIRRFILENDLLEALIALPEQLFYNTGIATYVWVVTNRKARARHGKVQLIDASHFDQDTKTGLFCTLMRKSLGDKRDPEVKPHVPDAWIETSKRDPKDGLVGLVGYEINFNRYFYRYTPPRPLEEIEADIREFEQDIVRMLSEVTGTGADR